MITSVSSSVNTTSDEATLDCFAHASPSSLITWRFTEDIPSMLHKVNANCTLCLFLHLTFNLLLFRVVMKYGFFITDSISWPKFLILDSKSVTHFGRWSNKNGIAWSLITQKNCWSRSLGWWSRVLLLELVPVPGHGAQISARAPTKTYVKTGTHARGTKSEQGLIPRNFLSVQ